MSEQCALRIRDVDSAVDRMCIHAAHGKPDAPPSTTTAQRWYYAARTAAGITRQGGIHTLRHCHATHLLEAGFNLHSISQWLGHSHIGATTRYLRLEVLLPIGRPDDACARHCAEVRRCKELLPPLLDPDTEVIRQ